MVPPTSSKLFSAWSSSESTSKWEGPGLFSQIGVFRQRARENLGSNRDAFKTKAPPPGSLLHHLVGSPLDWLWVRAKLCRLHGLETQQKGQHQLVFGEEGVAHLRCACKQPGPNPCDLWDLFNVVAELYIDLTLKQKLPPSTRTTC